MRFSRDYRELRFKNTIIPLPYAEADALPPGLRAHQGAVDLLDRVIQALGRAVGRQRRPRGEAGAFGHSPGVFLLAFSDGPVCPGGGQVVGALLRVTPRRTAQGATTRGIV